ncbi:uncharacterized protein LOC143144623 isoform X1 [Ptiloglossa arizonensis]|uniref:uncharacterized protein LOC143144623 isoform X1 n=1 Tax=Ptiloglossa arizonensis TaxID=3350558 RepID=UPI003F9F32CE
MPRRAWFGDGVAPRAPQLRSQLRRCVLDEREHPYSNSERTRSISSFQDRQREPLGTDTLVSCVRYWIPWISTGGAPGFFTSVRYA